MRPGRAGPALLLLLAGLAPGSASAAGREFHGPSLGLNVTRGSALKYAPAQDNPGSSFPVEMDGWLGLESEIAWQFGTWIAPVAVGEVGLGFGSEAIDEVLTFAAGAEAHYQPQPGVRVFAQLLGGRQYVGSTHGDIVQLAGGAEFLLSRRVGLRLGYKLQRHVGKVVNPHYGSTCGSSGREYDVEREPKEILVGMHFQFGPGKEGVDAKR